MKSVATPKSLLRTNAITSCNSSFFLPVTRTSRSSPLSLPGGLPVFNGGVGFEQVGDVGLLRSLVVRREAQARKLGSSLVVEAERLARSVGIRELVLLTQTAADFFERRGYARIERTTAPSAIAQSSEFRTLCPSTATCMIKSLG